MRVTRTQHLAKVYWWETIGQSSYKPKHQHSRFFSKPTEGEKLTLGAMCFGAFLGLLVGLTIL